MKDFIDAVIEASETVGGAADAHGFVVKPAKKAVLAAESDALYSSEKGVIKRILKAARKALNKVFAPGVSDLLMISAAVLAIATNPIGAGFGAAAAAVVLGKYCYDSYGSIADAHEKITNDIKLSKHVTIAQLERQIIDECKGRSLSADDLKAAGLLSSASVSKSETAEIKVSKFKRIFEQTIDKGSTASFGIAAAAVVIDPIMLVTSVLGYVISVAGSSKKAISEREHNKMIVALCRVLESHLCTDDTTLEMAIARRMQLLKALPKTESIDELKEHVKRESHATCEQLMSSLPQPPSMLELTKDYFKSKKSIEATREFSGHKHEKVDSAISESLDEMGARVELDSGGIINAIKMSRIATTTGPKMVRPSIKTETTPPRFSPEPSKVVHPPKAPHTATVATTGPRFMGSYTTSLARKELQDRDSLRGR